MKPKQFFLNLNSQIENARTQMALKVLEKHGKRYVRDLPSTTDKKILRESKTQLKKSLVLIKKKSKKLG